jgi:hypothetical protein
MLSSLAKLGRSSLFYQSRASFSAKLKVGEAASILKEKVSQIS